MSRKITMEEVSNILVGLPEVLTLDNAEQEKQFRDTMNFAKMCVGFTSAIMSEWANADEERTPESVEAFVDIMCGMTAVITEGYESIDIKDFLNFTQD